MTFTGTRQKVRTPSPFCWSNKSIFFPQQRDQSVNSFFFFLFFFFFWKKTKKIDSDFCIWNSILSFLSLFFVENSKLGIKWMEKHSKPGTKSKSNFNWWQTMHCRPWIGLCGSFGIRVKIFISVIWLKLCGVVKVTYEHTSPVHMAAFMTFLSEKKRPKWTLSQKF